MREGDEDGAEPLRRPEELDGLDPVLRDRGDAVTSADAGVGKSSGESRCPQAQLRVGQADVVLDDGLGVRGSLRRIEETEGEVHPFGAEAVRKIASTIGS